MAEILLSLTIIGVVAAITLPSLTGNINERTWNTQRKALYARISQAISLMPALNGYGTLDATTDTATETFIASGLSKVLKINNICSNNNLQDCAIVSKFTNFNAQPATMPTTLYSLNETFSTISWAGLTYSTKDTKAAAFETQNGESIIAFYNRACRAEYLNNSTIVAASSSGFPQSTMCVNLIYDLNGKKGPNTVGKDIGYITIFNATDSIAVMPIPSSTTNASIGGSSTMDWENASKACTQQDSESRLPNIHEVSAMMINKSLTPISNSEHYWTSTVFYTNAPGQTYTTQIWTIINSARVSYYKSHTDGIARCVKR